MRFEPVIALALVEHNLQRAQAERDETQPNIVNARLTQLPAPEVGWVLNQTRGQQQRQDPDRNVDEENPPPGVVVGNPPAERGSNRRRHHHRDSVHGKGHSAFGGREGIGENGLLTRLQTAAADSLQNPENNEGGKVGRKAAQK